MRILIVTGKMNAGGMESHVYDLARNLAAEGHFVCVVSEGGFYARRLAECGVHTITLPIDRKNPMCIAQNIFLLCKILRGTKCNIIHAHTRVAAAVCSMVSRITGTPLVVSIHAKFRMGMPLGSISRWGEASIAVSEDLKAHLVNNSRDVLADNVFVVPNGVDTKRFSPSESKKSGGELLFVSRLDRDCSRAAYLLCKIAPQLYGKIPDLHITVVGGGSEYASIRERANRVNRKFGREIIRMTGSVDDTSQYLKRTDMFVGVSRAAIEAMCCGVRVILAGNEGFGGALGSDNIKRLSFGNFCARECPQLTEQRLLDEILRLARENGEDRHRRECFLRKYAVENHSSSKMAAECAAVYSRLLTPKAQKWGSVLLCGYYGFGNMGDDALLCRSIRRAHARFPHLCVRALTAHGSRDRLKFGVPCAQRINPISLVREISRARVVVLGGGTLLQNRTSRRSLWYYLLLILFAEILGKRVELWGNGIDPIDGRLARMATAAAIKNCHAVCVRDRASLCVAKGLCADKKISIECDLASKTPLAPQGRIDYILQSSGIGKRKFAVAVFRGVEEPMNIARMYKRLRLICKSGVLPVVIVMCEREDLQLSREICRRLGGVLLLRLGASDTVGVMSRASVVLGMRYHALVFAKAGNTVGIPYGTQPKIKSLGNFNVQNKNDC